MHRPNGLTPLGERIGTRLSSRVQRASEIVAEEIADDVRFLLDVQGTPVNRSRPGEAPRKQTGKYQASIRSDARPDRTGARVYSTSKIGAFLEKGTSRMAARPHFAKVRAMWRGKFGKRLAEVMRTNGR